MGEFGDKFRKQREKNGISLQDASNATKISCRMLQAIEEEKFDRLPGGIFNKGFVRAYAKHLGLNDDEAVSGYVACVRGSQPGLQDAWDVQPEEASSSSGNRRKLPPTPEELPDLQLPRADHVRVRRGYVELRGPRNSTGLVALTVVVILLVVLLWRRHTPAPQPVTSAPSPSTVQSSTPSPKPPSPAGTNPGTAPLATTRDSRPTAPHTPNPNPRPPSNPPGGAASAAQITKDANPSGENSSASSAAPAQPSPASEGPLHLIILASENSWISVTSDGRPVLHELLIAPAHASIHAAREISVRVGNAGGVTFVWNGREFPAQGAESEVVTLMFDASGLRILPTLDTSGQNR